VETKEMKNVKKISSDWLDLALLYRTLGIQKRRAGKLAPRVRANTDL